ncbi:MAG: sel1 repeat family protein, partial [Selenomonadales bacterium]|nr:sel1 repeat family protein [Selenomonadales bacterium]
MKRLSNHIKRTLLLTALSCASVCIMPNILCDAMPVCIASEVSVSDEERIIQELQQEAEAGNAEAQYKLGNRYYYGKYTEENYGKAVYWYLQAAKQGDVAAQIILAECYSWRDVLPRDKELEIYWYTQAAEQGDVSAQFHLAEYYDR